jgi:hypothetical protein
VNEGPVGAVVALWERPAGPLYVGKAPLGLTWCGNGY